MHIELVSIENYKCFLERQTFQFEPGFNLLLGANNSGKTTVLDVLDMEPALNEPHRSVRTIPQYGGQPHHQSEFSVSIATRVSELSSLLGGSQFYLPLAPPLAGESLQPDSEPVKRALAHVANDGNLRLVATFGHSLDAVNFEGGDSISGRASRHTPNDSLWAVLLQFTSPFAPPHMVGVTNAAGVQGSAGQYYVPYKQRIFRFNAQRRPGTDCGSSGTAQLDRETAMLPYWINHLQTNDSYGHQQLCEWVRRVFPNIHWVQAPPAGGNFQVQCLAHAPQDRRNDLAKPLSRMGTGIGNVIAMLYVVLTARAPQVIAIDEPNAFLHPRALRELLSILESEGKQHQFLVSAHSPDVLTAVDARTISMLEFDGTATRVTHVGPKDLHSLRGGLADLGIRMTDLHSRDRVLWVEGQTEELVMPELLRYACPEVAAGTAVLRVERTGTFSKKSIEPHEVMKIYERLSISSALVPPMVAILLDGEQRTSDDRRKIEHESGGKLRFLGLPMLENYLLDSEAIAAALSELGQTVSPSDVQRALSTLSESIRADDGAAALRHVFSNLSDSRHEFRKTRDVPALVNWLIKHRPDRLKPLRQCLRSIFCLAH